MNGHPLWWWDQSYTEELGLRTGEELGAPHTAGAPYMSEAMCGIGESRRLLAWVDVWFALSREGPLMTMEPS
jgi:hypothetical protein